MGKYISKFVFQPPGKFSIFDSNDKILLTKHNSKIQFKYINRGAKLNLLVSHGNAEDINSVKDWAENYLYRNININLVMYGIYSNTYLK